MSSLRKNFVYNVIYQILVIILPIITAPYVSRVLGVEGIGTYSYTYSIAQYFLLFAMLGVTNFGNRSIAMVRDDKETLSKTFWNIFAIQSVNATIVAVIYVLFVLYTYDQNEVIALIQIIFVLSGIFDINWFYFGIEKFKLTVTTNFCTKILTVVMIFVFVNNEDDLWKYALIMSIGVFISQSIVWVFIRQYIHFVKPDIKFIKQSIKPFFILFVPVLAYSVYRFMAKIMIGNLSDITQVGYYENADKIIVIPLGIITALGTVMLPRLSNLAANGKSELQNRYIEMSMKYVSIIASALMFGIAGISTVLAPVYFGSQFIPSGNLIMYLAPIILFSSFANVLRTQFLIPNKKDNLYVFSMISAAFLSFVLNIIFIPSYGANGAVIGTIVAEFSVMFFQAFGVRNELPLKKYFKDNYIYIFFGFIMFLVVKLIGVLFATTIMTLLIQVIVGVVIYSTMVLIYMIIKKDDFLNIILNLFKKATNSVK